MRSSTAVWGLAGLVLLAAAAGWTLLSGQFVYGQGHAQRPILGYLLLFALAWCAFAVAVRGQSSGGGVRLWWIVAVAVAARVILLPSGLIQENDVYRYVLDGQTLLHGSNPYAHAPLVVSEFAPEPLRSSLAGEEARGVLSRIGYPHISTVYPPLAQGVFALGAAVSGWDWKGQRWVFAAADLAVLSLLVVLLRRLALPATALLLWAWNPLVLKEVINSAHLDAVVCLFLLLTLAFLLKGERGVWVSLAGVALALAVLTKIYPLILLPAILIFVWRRGGAVQGLQFTACLSLVAVMAVLPFAAVGWERLTAGLAAYAGQWTMNAGAFLILDSFFAHPRLLAAALVLAAAIAVPVLRRSRTVGDLVEDLQWILLLWFLLLPAAFPWYALCLAALWPLGRPASGPSLATLALCGATGAYYLSFYFEYHDYSSNWWMLTQAAEHAVIWAVLLMTVLKKGDSLLYSLFSRDLLAERRS